MPPDTGKPDDPGLTAEPRHEFKPDWCLAPAATLREWLDENGLSPRVAVAGGVPRHRRDEATAMIGQVLDGQPLTGEHARILEKGTGIPARFWLALEHNYRAGLAAGLKDVTDWPDRGAAENAP